MSQSRRGTRSRQAPSTDASDDESKSVTDSTDQDQEESGESNASVASPPPPPCNRTTLRCEIEVRRPEREKQKTDFTD